MSEVMLGLGDFRFSVETAAYDTLRRSESYRWAAQDRIGRNPALQYLGGGGAAIELDGVIYPHFKGGLGQVAAMRREAAKGKPLILVSSKGETWGKFVIERVEETQTRPIAGGQPRKIEFRIELKRYDDKDYEQVYGKPS